MESVMDFICVGSCRLSRNKNWNHQETVGNHRKPPGNHPPKTSETTPESFDGQSAWSHVCVGTCGCHRDRTQKKHCFAGSPPWPTAQMLFCPSYRLRQLAGASCCGRSFVSALFPLEVDAVVAGREASDERCLSPMEAAQLETNTQFVLGSVAFWAAMSSGQAGICCPTFCRACRCGGPRFGVN